MTEILYKYLDIEGGLAMLKYHNLQFTNATRFNDPFDGHPALFDYSNVPPKPNNWPPADFISLKEKTNLENLRNSTWISCFSKVYDRLLMWAYYNNHKGICIGMDKEMVLKCCNYKFFGLMFPFAKEVVYIDIHKKPDYFKERPTFYDLLITKAKDWEHEQEVRIITTEPAWVHEGTDIPKDLYNEESVDIREVRHYPIISSDCFESVYLGVSMYEHKKKEVIDAAKKLNPNIKIYQMTIDPEAFRLKAMLLQE